MKGVEKIMRMLDSLLLERKHQAPESERLRSAYLSPKWAATDVAFEDFVMDMFRRPFTCDAEELRLLDESWPRGDRFKTGAERIRVKHLPDLRRWVSKQRQGQHGAAATAEPPPPAPPADGAGHL